MKTVAVSRFFEPDQQVLDNKASSMVTVNRFSKNTGVGSMIAKDKKNNLHYTEALGGVPFHVDTTCNLISLVVSEEDYISRSIMLCY